MYKLFLLITLLVFISINISIAQDGMDTKEMAPEVPDVKSMAPETPSADDLKPEIP